LSCRNAGSFQGGTAADFQIYKVGMKVKTLLNTAFENFEKRMACGAVWIRLVPSDLGINAPPTGILFLLV